MNTVLYIQTGKTAEISGRYVHLKDVANVFCIDKGLACRCSDICIRDMGKETPGMYTMSVLELIEKIKNLHPEVEVTAIGVPDVVFQYKTAPKNAPLWDWIKATFVSLILFFGAGFSIMTFNTEVETRALFARIHETVTGIAPSGFTQLELCYSLGIAAGVLFFFNHFSFKNKKQDPSALAVQLHTYEQDVQAAVIEENAKKGA